MGKIKSIFAPKWRLVRKCNSKAEMREVQAVFEYENVCYRLFAYTRESRTLAASPMFTNVRNQHEAYRNAYISDLGTETYTFEVHRRDYDRAMDMVRSIPKDYTNGGYISPTQKIR